MWFSIRKRNILFRFSKGYEHGKIANSTGSSNLDQDRSTLVLLLIFHRSLQYDNLFITTIGSKKFHSTLLPMKPFRFFAIRDYRSKLCKTHRERSNKHDY
jgi:hypothetical protein